MISCIIHILYFSLSDVERERGLRRLEKKDRFGYTHSILYHVVIVTINIFIGY